MNYEVVVPLTLDQKAQIEAGAREQARSVSSYVGKFIAKDLARG